MLTSSPAASKKQHTQLNLVKMTTSSHLGVQGVIEVLLALVKAVPPQHQRPAQHVFLRNSINIQLLSFYTSGQTRSKGAYSPITWVQQ